MNDLLKKARLALKKSHSPYSGRRIGAAIRLTNGKIFSGTNIENASYGATVCAERVAIWKAVSEFPKARLQEIVVCNEAAKAWPPCGMCRQVIAEFATDDLKVFLANNKSIEEMHMFTELFPLSFTPNHLKKSTAGAK